MKKSKTLRILTVLPAFVLFCTSCAQPPIATVSEEVSYKHVSSVTTEEKKETVTIPSKSNAENTERRANDITLNFSDLDTYTATLKTFTDKEAILAYGKDPTIKYIDLEKNLNLLLEEKYFLVPNIPPQYILAEIVFTTVGHSSIIMMKKGEEDVKFVWGIYHGKEPNLLYSLELTRLYSFTNERGQEIVRYNLNKKAPFYVWKEEDTVISVLVQGNAEEREEYLVENEQFLKTLTFEKVKIK